MRPLLICGIALVTACSASTSKDEADDTDVAAETDLVDTACELQEGEVISLTDRYDEGTEGVALSPDGRLLITARERAIELDRDGEEVAEWPAPSSIGAMWWRDAFWVTSGENEDGDKDPALIEIKDGTATRHPLDGVRSPNFIVPTPWDTVLIAVPTVTDDADKIFEWDPETGTTTVWSEAVPSPNGLVFAEDDTALYVATTFAEHSLRRIALNGQAAGEATIMASFAATSSPDGIALEADGGTLVALNTGHSITRVTRAGETYLSTHIADVPFPASIAHGTEGWPRCSAVVTSLFSSEVFLVGTGRPGAPTP